MTATLGAGGRERLSDSPIRKINLWFIARRRFPPPWSVEEYNNACFVVRDHNGQALAYVYYEEKPGRRSAAKLLERDEARRIAVNIVKPTRVGSNKPDSGPRTSSSLRSLRSLSSRIDSHRTGSHDIRSLIRPEGDDDVLPQFRWRCLYESS